jgi:hypothetical protein
MTTTSRPDGSISKSWPATPDMQEAIRRRAEEIYIRNGKIPGRDVQNWMQAEEEVRQEYAMPAARRTAVIINVNGVRYTGEYTHDSAGGYTPGEFRPGQPIPVRFRGDKMLVKRRNGSELETTIVHRVG